ncbi:hypothetical protein [Pedobacter rhodius]|uniref:Uncharacterized protein n=1 Tax=Pedobacter rhodius TaxID=3004098 RepID=A0ABT4KYB6_9SPHI|nr:hypothetical protein [Pedobacter sp. SJ11]MCZ4223931.1 hypothetical protein [Pedobacter sp. SJ11]
MNNSIMATLFSLVSIISPLLVLIGSIYYISKKVGADSILLLIGSGIGFLINVFYILIPYLISRNNMPASKVTQLYPIVGIVSIFSGISFAVGFFILVYNTIAKQNSIGNQFSFNKD